MATPAAEQPSDILPMAVRTRYLWLIMAIAGLLLVCVTYPLQNYFFGKTTRDYQVWYDAGQTILHGEELYPQDKAFPFMYPPIAAIMLAPLSAGGSFPMLLALVTINVAAWLACLLLGVYLATGQAFGHRPLIYFVPTACSGAFTYDAFQLGQVNIVLLALLLGSFACLRAKRGMAAGMLIAVAAGMKAFPIMAVGYLVWRRQWKAVASVTVTLALMFTVIPYAVRGYDQGRADVRDWANGMLFNYDKGQIGQRTSRAYSWKNQSLVGLANRMLRHNLADENPDRQYYVNVVDLDFRTTNGIILGTALALCLYFVAVLPRRRQLDHGKFAVETAMLTLLILMLSPYAFGYFFVWLMYPVTVLTCRWQSTTTDRRALGVLLAVAIALPMTTIIHQRTAEAYGNYFLSSLVMLFALGWQLRRRPALVAVSTRPALAA